MIIGYQGDEYSNSWKVCAEHYPHDMHLPLISSMGIRRALLDCRIDKGIMELWNTLTGEVEETKDVLKKKDIYLVQVHDLQIRHYVYSKRNTFDGITEIWSHKQDLVQSEDWINMHLPNAIQVNVTDPAQSARRLAMSDRDDVAIICRKEAGEAYGLHQLSSNACLGIGNRTVFGVFESEYTLGHPREKKSTVISEKYLFCPRP